MLKRRIPIPQIYQGADYRLWIDRYYIAAQRLADESVRYAYLTRIHIRSELLANRNSIRKNGFALLDSEALAEFAAARRAMERYQTDYALRLSCPTEGGTARASLYSAPMNPSRSRKQRMAYFSLGASFSVEAAHFRRLESSASRSMKSV